MTPAAPNTYVVTKDPGASEGYTKEPIIGYVYNPADEKPPVVVTLSGQRRLLGESGVMFSCGMVVDPLHSAMYESVEDWVEAAPKSTRSQHTAEAPSNPASTTDVETEGYDIEWTNKSFKNNSFWHYDDGEYEFCFILPGEENAPKQTEKMQKIKRTDLDALKKSIDLLDLDDVKNPNVLPDSDPDEEEDDDDDDDDGLI